MTLSMSRRMALFGAAGGLTLSASLPAQAKAQGGEQRIVHAAGETVLTARPQRVAVYDLGALDILDALGVDVVAVPGARFPAYLSRYDDAAYAKVGTLFEPDLDAVRAARPDLIVVGGRSASQYAALSAVAPTIDITTSTTGFVASVVKNTLLFGRIFDKQAEASARTERLLAAIDGLHDKTRGQKGLVLFAVGSGAQPQPPYSRFGILYEILGMEPVAAPFEFPPAAPRGAAQDMTETQRAQLAQEQAARLAVIMDRDPDWLLVLDRASATGGEHAAPALLAASPFIVASRAYAENRVVHMDAPGWYLVGGGVSNIEAAITQFTTALSEA